MDDSIVSQLLTRALIVLAVILFILIIIYIILKSKSNVKNKKEKKSSEIKLSPDSNKKEEKKFKLNKKTSKNVGTTYNKQSIFDFMEFDTIEDNMIVQKDSKRFVMAIECQGINYDLMSQMEKVAVEEGFQQFLNTLRHPIQIYIQTRTINLEENINRYKTRIKDLEQKYNKMAYEYRKMQESQAYSEEDRKKYYYELTKQKNLLDYGKDVVSNAEQMSLNKNILNKKYYVVISHYVEENNSEKYDKEEIRNIAFSELYTKAQAMIRTLTACSVAGKILNSRELIELLYMAYNRDDAELYGLDSILDAQYDSLYSTAQDVFEKKLKYLDKEIEDRALEKANEAVNKAKSKAQKMAETKEDSMKQLIDNLAQIIIKENRQYVGAKVAEEAIQEIKNEEGKEDVEQEEVSSSTGARKN